MPGSDWFVSHSSTIDDTGMAAVNAWYQAGSSRTLQTRMAVI